MNKKPWKQKIIAILVYILMINAINTNTALASYNSKNIIVDNVTVKVNKNETQKKGIKSISEEESFPEFNEILEECKEVKLNDASTEIKKGEKVSVESVSGNRTITIAVMSNGDLYCWGRLKYDTKEIQTTPLKVLSDVKSVSAYFDSVSAITMNGDLYYWNYNKTTPVKILSDVKQVSSAMAAITMNGDLYCWGANGSGQVGNGTTEYQTEPVKVLSDVKSVYSSNGSISAITTNGDLYCWGNNGNGQVGNGTKENQTEPVKILSGVQFVYSSNSSISAITTNGDLYCWGANHSGQVVNGTRECLTKPVKMLSNVKSTYSFYDSDAPMAAITMNGDLYCWGANGRGQVGNGTKEDQTEPVKVLNNVKLVYSKGLSMTAITTNGDLYCWGRNDSGQIGNGTKEDQIEPVKVLSDVKSFSYHEDHTAWSSGVSISAITTDGDLYCWGNNIYGQIGNGTKENQTEPVKVLSNVKSLFTPYNSISVITTNGDLYRWGNNEYGQIGNGTTEDQTTPFKVSFDTLSDEDKTSVTGLKLDKNTLSLTVGSSETLNAIIEPSNAYNQNILWSSNNTSVAVVSGSGIVSAVNVGTAEIKAKTEDGGYESICAVTVTNSDDGEVTSSSSPSLRPSDNGSISGGDISIVFTPVPTATPIETPLPSTEPTLTPIPELTPVPIVTVTPSATPVIISTTVPSVTVAPVSSNSLSPDNGDDNYNTDSVYEISDIAAVTLSTKTFVYNGKEKKPKVTVKKDNFELIENTNYTVSYYDNTKVGTASITINGIGNYSGSINKTFKIVPKGTSIKGKLKSEHKGFTVKWNKQIKSVTGYQVQYSTNKKFNVKTTIKTIKKKFITKLRISKLKAKKKYYVKVRTYKTVKGKKYCSKWSTVKKVTTKK